MDHAYTYLALTSQGQDVAMADRVNEFRRVAAERREIDIPANGAASDVPRHRWAFAIRTLVHRVIHSPATATH